MSRHARKLWLGLTLALATSVGLLGAPAQADGPPDWDGDGAVAGDCRPLDGGVHPGATDLPDLAFEDRNCDGIDGDPDDAFFVYPGGSDANVGTPNAPLRTIQAAVARAVGSPTKKSIYVTTGTFERTALGSTADGIRIYGGYEAGTWARTTSTTSVVNGSPEALLLDGATDVVVQLMTLNGSRGGQLSAYGVRAVNNSEIALIKATASAGPGGAGTNGSGGVTPVKAASGAPGSSGPSDCNIAGSGGWQNQFGVGTSGGAGGAGGEETNDGENGQAGGWGEGTGGGAPGGGGIDIDGDSHGINDGMHGGNGSPGQPGGNGGNGGGGANDFGNAGTAWAGRDGADGGSGGAGYGGGGGGGGSGRGGTWDWGAGAGGGQGGEGGAPGTQGTRGSWGGGSFGVYLHNSQSAVVAGSTLAAGQGGKGGDGGSGATGGEGGDGGAGAQGRNCGITVGNGGNGGKGGNGGNGGNGGGGSGGPSLSLARIGTSAATAAASTLTYATGGSGGANGGANSGAAGTVSPAGGPATDFDSDGITDAADACVEVHRGTDGNGDGCPDRPAALPDGDGDGVPNDGRDKCPAQAAGTDADHNGCTDGSDPGPGPATTTTNPGTTTDTNTNTGTTGGAGTTPPAVLGPFDPRISSGYDYKGSKTTFTVLALRSLPKGSKVVASCKGGGCKFKRKAIATSGSKLNVLKKLGKVVLRSGAVLQLTITGPQGQRKVVTWKVRTGKSPTTTYRCAAPGGKLGRCA